MSRMVVFTWRPSSTSTLASPKSPSTSRTRRPFWARAKARFTVRLVLPTPPLPLLRQAVAGLGYLRVVVSAITLALHRGSFPGGPPILCRGVAAKERGPFVHGHFQRLFSCLRFLVTYPVAALERGLQQIAVGPFDKSPDRELLPGGVSIHPEAGGQAHFAALEHHRRVLQGRLQALFHPHRGMRTGAGKNNAKFFTAVPAGNIDAPQILPPNPAGKFKGLVPRLVAESVVDPLEMVQIDHHQAGGETRPPGALHFLVQGDHHPPPVEKPGEGIGLGQFP